MPVPERFLEFCIEEEIGCAAQSVLLALLFLWRPEKGNSVAASFGRLAELCPLDRAYIHRVLVELARGRVVGRTSEPGKVQSVDLTPLLVKLSRPRNSQPQLSPGGDRGAQLLTRRTELLTRGNSTVDPAHGTVGSASLRVEPHSRGATQSRARAKQERELSKGEESSAPASADAACADASSPAGGSNRSSLKGVIEQLGRRYTSPTSDMTPEQFEAKRTTDLVRLAKIEQEEADELRRTQRG